MLVVGDVYVMACNFQKLQVLNEKHVLAPGEGKSNLVLDYS